MSAIEPTAESTQPAYVWHDMLTDLPLEGQGWADVERPGDRFPPRARERVPEDVWNLSRLSSGLSVSFTTDARMIRARWTLAWMPKAQAKCSRFMQAGLDCYGQAPDGRWHWVGIAMPLADGAEQECELNATPLDPGMRTYKLYLPLGAAVTKVEVGVPEGSTFSRPPRDKRLPIVYYGTSIVQGTTLSRPGMAHASMLSRWLNWPIINLGFSGRARLEAGVAQMMAELDASLYIVDCVPNVMPPQILERLPVFIETLRAAHPTTPILVVGDRLFGDAAFQAVRREDFEAKNRAQNAVLDELEQRGGTGLHRISSPNFFGDDYEGTSDASHPNDLGSYRMAVAIRDAVAKLLAGRSLTDE